MAITSRGKKRR